MLHLACVMEEEESEMGEENYYSHNFITCFPSIFTFLSA